MFECVYVPEKKENEKEYINKAIYLRSDKDKPSFCGYNQWTIRVSRISKNTLQIQTAQEFFLSLKKKSKYNMISP